MWDFMSGATGVIAMVTGAMLFFSGFITARKLAKSGDTQKYEEFIDQMEDGYYRSSLDGQQIYANQALVRLNGYDSWEEMQAGVKDIASEWYVDPKRRDRFSELLRENGSVSNFVSEIYRHKSRERIWISETARLMLTSDGRPSHYEGTVREVSDAVRRLELERLYRKFSEHVPGVMIQGRWSADGKFSIPFRTQGFERLFGELPGSVEDDATFLFRLLHRDDFNKFIETGTHSAKSGSPWELEFRVCCPDGRELWLDLKATPEEEADGACLWHGFMMDITDKKNADQRIRDLADLDPLTGLLNRRSLLRALRVERDTNADQSQAAALLRIDVDDFKTLNDAHGHSTGDRFLVIIGKRLREAAGEKASVARLGSDEYMVLLTGLDPDPTIATLHVEEVARRVLRSMRQPAEVDGQLLATGCSIGSTLVSATQLTGDELLRKADVALRIAKQEGKNQHMAFSPELLERMKVPHEFKEAINKAG